MYFPCDAVIAVEIHRRFYGRAGGAHRIGNDDEAVGDSAADFRSAEVRPDHFFVRIDLTVDGDVILTNTVRIENIIERIKTDLRGDGAGASEVHTDHFGRRVEDLCPKRAFRMECQHSRVEIDLGLRKLTVHHDLNELAIEKVQKLIDERLAAIGPAELRERREEIRVAEEVYVFAVAMLDFGEIVESIYILRIDKHRETPMTCLTLANETGAAAQSQECRHVGRLCSFLTQLERFLTN